MSSSVAQHPVLWLLAAVLLGMTVEWILEMFYVRQRPFDAESRARKRSEELDSERFAHGRTLTDLKGRLAELDTAQKGRTLAESLLQGARAKLSSVESGWSAVTEARHRAESELSGLRGRLDSAIAETTELRGC